MHAKLLWNYNYWAVKTMGKVKEVGLYMSYEKVMRWKGSCTRVWEGRGFIDLCHMYIMYWDVWDNVISDIKHKQAITEDQLDMGTGPQLICLCGRVDNSVTE